MLAASKGRTSFVRELLAHGADPNAEDADSWTALLCAAKEGYTDICMQLLEQNADIEHRDMVRNRRIYRFFCFSDCCFYNCFFNELFVL